MSDLAERDLYLLSMTGPYFKRENTVRATDSWLKKLKMVQRQNKTMAVKTLIGAPGRDSW